MADQEIVIRISQRWSGARISVRASYIVDGVVCKAVTFGRSLDHDRQIDDLLFLRSVDYTRDFVTAWRDQGLLW